MFLVYFVIFVRLPHTLPSTYTLYCSSFLCSCSFVLPSRVSAFILSSVSSLRVYSRVRILCSSSSLACSRVDLWLFRVSIFLQNKLESLLEYCSIILIAKQIIHEWSVANGDNFQSFFYILLIVDSDYNVGLSICIGNMKSRKIYAVWHHDKISYTQITTNV